MMTNFEQCKGYEGNLPFQKKKKEKGFFPVCNSNHATSPQFSGAIHPKYILKFESFSLNRTLFNFQFTRETRLQQVNYQRRTRYCVGSRNVSKASRPIKGGRQILTLGFLIPGQLLFQNLTLAYRLHQSPTTPLPGYLTIQLVFMFSPFIHSTYRNFKPINL